MSKEQFILFMDDQIKAIQDFKWMQSEKAGYDLGQKCIFKWIKKRSRKFRRNWIKRHGGLV